MEQENTGDRAADYLHNYPDFKVDMVNGMFLGEHSGRYYFYSKGNIGILDGDYSVANNVSNFFNGRLLQTNSKLLFIPPKMVLSCIQKVGDSETPSSFKCAKDFPFLAEALCLETMRRVEQTLPLKEGKDINGWTHFVVMLEKFVSQLGNKAQYFEGIDCYCFISSDDVLMQCNPEEGNYDWQFAEKVEGFRVHKKTIMTLINRQKLL